MSQLQMSQLHTSGRSRRPGAVTLMWKPRGLPSRPSISEWLDSPGCDLQEKIISRKIEKSMKIVVKALKYFWKFFNFMLKSYYQSSYQK